MVERPEVVETCFVGDLPCLALRLDQAIAGVDALPLALEERVPVAQPEPPAKDEPAWRRSLREVWQELRQLVRIENLDLAGYRTIMGVNVDWQQVVKGLVLLGAVVFDVYNKNK